MAVTPEQDAVPFQILTDDEAGALFDTRVRELLGISGAEFLRRLDAGEYDDIYDDPDHPEIVDLDMLRPFAR